MNKRYLEEGFRKEAERQLGELETQLRKADENIKDRERERSQIKAEVAALRSLLAIDDGQPLDVLNSTPRYTIDPRDVAIEILREKNGEEMHYKMLAQEVATWRASSREIARSCSECDYEPRQEVREAAPARFLRIA